jgi:hypothetical protein
VPPVPPAPPVDPLAFNFRLRTSWATNVMRFAAVPLLRGTVNPIKPHAHGTPLAHHGDRVTV